MTALTLLSEIVERSLNNSPGTTLANEVKGILGKEAEIELNDEEDSLVRNYIELLPLSEWHTTGKLNPFARVRNDMFLISFIRSCKK
ncbi:MAG: hypothetical protein Q8915_19090 [Bacillota bacterium]|nr:hypothetical protein [Bacillota bacterium]